MGDLSQPNLLRRVPFPKIMKLNLVDQKPRVLLLLPTRTYRANDFLSAARQLDVEVVIASDHPQTLSELSPLKSLSLDFRCPEPATQKITAFAKDYPLDAVVGVDDDTTILATMAAKELSLPHNTIEAAYATRNKHQLRKTLAEAGLHSPWFKLLSVNENPEKIANQIDYPCVLKPLSLSASRGVIRANDLAQFTDAFDRVVAILQSSSEEDEHHAKAEHLLVEGFIPGTEVALEGIVVRGKLKVLAIFDKPDPLDGPFFEETLYITPSRLPADVQQEIASCTADAAKALGLREGPVHAELRIKDGCAWMLEIAPRSIGGLCARTLRFGTGMSLEELIIRHAIGHDVNSFEREEKAAGVMMIPIPHAGILREVSGQSQAEAVEGIEEVTITIPIGQEVVPLPAGKQYLGFIFARGETANDVETALRKAHHRLEFAIEP